MNDRRPIQPPRWPFRIIRKLINTNYVEELEGDLEERFHDNLKKYNKREAQRRYLSGALRLMRPTLLKNPSGDRRLNHYGMFKHNFIIAFRNFRRYKTSFLINLIGLSSGLACALFIYLWVDDEQRIDKFHESGSRIFHVLKNSPDSNGDLVVRDTAPVRMAQVMTEDFPEVEMAVAVISNEWKGVISSGEKHLKAKHQFVGKDYFNVFSYKLLHGDKDQVLDDPTGVLLSDDLAMKLFSTTESLVGKMVDWKWSGRFSGTYMITGIFEAPSSYSSKKFDLIFTRDKWIEANNDDCWCSNNAKTYLVLKEDTDLMNFGEKIRDYSKAKMTEFEGPGNLRWEGTLQIQKYSDQYLHGHFENGVQAGGRIEYVRLFAVIGFFVLIIACINFMNLSTARAARRVKEVGIKKALGVRRKSMIRQYLGESILITLFSLLVAVTLTLILLPAFEALTEKDFSWHVDSNFIFFICGITLVTGVVAGSYPAFYLSGFKPVMVLKGQLRATMGEKWVRQGLVVFQFMVSVILIVSVIVVFRQIEFIQTKNLGYDKDNIIRIENEGKLREDSETFLNEVRKIGGVINASSMSGDLVGFHSGGGRINWEGKTAGLGFDGFYVNYDLIETLGFELVAGRTFSKEYGHDHGAVLFNETAIARMGLEDPIGKTVEFWGENKTIIGIVKDFHYESFYQEVEPFFFSFEDKNNDTVIKIAAGREKEVLSEIEAFHDAYNGGLPFEYEFIDQDYDRLYAAENRVATLINYFAAVAILISCLGLFGLASFTAERRQKEIGIRKVLGAGELNIVRLLSSDFTKTVLLAIVISLPLSYLIVSGWLDGFAYRIDLRVWFFGSSGLVALFIAWITVVSQTLSAARTNPVECLRDE